MKLMNLAVNQFCRIVFMISTIIVSAEVCASETDNIQPSTVTVGPGDVANMGMSLALIVLMIFAVGWLYRRMQGMHSHKGEVFKILATQPLGPKERVLLVEVAGKQLVLGMTTSQIQTLHVLDTPLVSEPADPVPISFADRLRIAIRGVTK